MVTVKKIRHRDRDVIGIFFKYDDQKIAIARRIGATFSMTNKCWYVDYNVAAYKQIKESFNDIVIELNEDLDKMTSQKVTDATDRDHLPIALSEFQLGTNTLGNPEHSRDETSLAIKLRLTLLEPIGKYWVFKMQYHQAISKQLLAVKGVYWNASYKCYMAFRHENVKQKVEQILETSSFFGTNYLSEDKTVQVAASIEIKAHVEDVSWLEVHVPKLVLVHEKIKRFSMARFSTVKKCYLLPAAPSVLEGLELQMDAIEVNVINKLPAGYLQNKYLPNHKQLQLTKTRESLLKQVPEHAQKVVHAMIDMLLARNYSYSTIRTYTLAFMNFIRHFDYQYPENIEKSAMIKYLGSLMQSGLTATTGSTMVNSIQFYFRQVLGEKHFDFQLPRPKPEKKLPAVLTMEECLGIFKVVDNPKHKLMLLIGYGAGLRVSEIVHLKWCDILFAEFKIHVKNAKGKKDRMVMLPYSIVHSLQVYKELYAGKNYVFEGQFAGEPYNVRSVQEVMRMAVKKSGLSKKASVHTLRHSFATHLLEAGTDIRYIQNFLGHASITTTMVYTHLTKGAVDKIQSPLDRIVDLNSDKKIE